MVDTAAVAPAAPAKSVGLFQDPHFWGVLHTIGGAVMFATSYASFVPTPIQPWVMGAGIVWAAGAQIFHIFGLVNPASTQTVPTQTVPKP